LARTLQINVPVEQIPPVTIIDAAARLFVQVADHRKKKLWGRISVEVVMEGGDPSKVTVTCSEVYNERQLAERKLKVDGQE